MSRKAIVQMFNLPFRKIQSSLPRLQKLGLTHILISPPQKSNSSTSWWGRYQPVDYRVIEGPLGNRHELESLCWEAGRRGMRIMADAVLNHMSNEPRYVRAYRNRIVEAQFPRFSKNDFHERLSNAHGGGRGLADLRMDSPWVRSELRDYLRMLYGIGIRGYRFDAAKHIDPDFFDYVLEGIPDDCLCFGELVYGSSHDFPGGYWRTMRAYDFPLAHTLKVAFAHGGDLGTLINPHDRGGALWGPLAVTFVNKHDLIKNRRSFDFFRIGDVHDRHLSHVYLLGRQDGIPCLYTGDLRNAFVKAGLEFHQLAHGQPIDWIHASHNQLMWTRGPYLLAAINKAGHAWTPGPVGCGLAHGVYRDLLGGPSQYVDEYGRWHACRVPGRGAVLLLRT